MIAPGNDAPLEEADSNVMPLPLILLAIGVLANQTKPSSFIGFLRDPVNSAERNLDLPISIPLSYQQPLVPAKTIDSDITDSSEVPPTSKIMQDETSAQEFLKMFLHETEADMPHLFSFF